MLAATLSLICGYAVAHKAIEKPTLSHHHKPSHLLVDEPGIREEFDISRDETPDHSMNLVKHKGSAKTLQPRNTTLNCVSIDQLANATSQSRNTLLQSNTDFDCLADAMWSVETSHMQALFNQGAVTSITQRAVELAGSYDGTNNNQLQNFILYLRVSFWVQGGNQTIVGDYDANLLSDVDAFLSAFANNSHYFNTDEVHAYNAKEVMILMFTKNWRSNYLPQGIAWLQRYDKSWGANMQRLLTKSLTLFYNGSFDDGFKAEVERNRSLVTALDSFLKDNTDLIGHNNEYQFNDAASELGRLLGYGGQTYQETKVLVRDFLSRYSMTGEGAKAWLKMASQADYYDQANCSYYNICNYKQTLEAQVLPITHLCSSSVRVRAQALSTAQLAQICSDLAAQETYFHQRLQTNNVPVTDDNNDTLELVIYDSSSDYKTYSGILFGHSTDNGGIYLEGDPAIVGNIPRFFAHEAEWLLPEFAVWNLTHEYVHYLDGRFNKYGTFSDGYDHNTVWWAEGLAEYISKRNRNDGAIEDARNGTYTLSTLFTTTYDNSAAQVYDWSYLAVRYMFEKRTSDIDTLLVHLRSGDYQAFDNHLANINGNYDSDFAQWLQTVESTDDDSQPGTGQLTNGQTVLVSAQTGEQPAFYADIPADSANLLIQTSGGTSGDADLHVKFASPATTSDYDYRPWKNGNEETVSVAIPDTGRWHIMLNPYNPFNDVSLQISWQEDGGTGPAIPDACVSLHPVTRGNLQSGTAICAGSATLYMAIYVESGASNLSIRVAHGDGDSNLYHRAGGWPSDSAFDHSSRTTNSNEENVLITHPTSGWHYIMLQDQGEGTTLLAEID